MCGKRLRLPTVRETRGATLSAGKTDARVQCTCKPLKPAWFGEPMLAPVINYFVLLLNLAMS
jgi:hypothetical protein